MHSAVRLFKGRDGRTLIPSSMLVGYDGSAPSRAAVRWALRRADDLASSLVVCHVVDDDSRHPEASPAFLSLADCAAWLGAECGPLHHEFPLVELTVVVRTGRPPFALAELARDADMVVIGTHKTGFIHGRAFESRFAALPSEIAVPLAVVPDTDLSHRRGAVAGIGGFPSTTAILRHAATEARRWGDPLILLGSWVDTRSSERSIGSSPDRSPSAQVERTLREAARFAQAEDPTLTVRIRSIRRERAEALIDASLAARTLVIGHSAVSSLRSVVPDVLLNLSCPTIIIREPVPAEPVDDSPITPTEGSL